MTVDRNPEPKSEPNRLPPGVLPPWWLPPSRPGREEPADTTQPIERQPTQMLSGWPRVFPGL